MELASLVALAAVLVAAVNGANDNFKGVATLFGSGTTRYSGALAWGTACTFAGSLAALFLADALLATFSGAGLVSASLVGAPAFVAAVALGASGAVLLATRLSFPVSTTHALTGSLVGAGWVMGGEVQLAVLGSKFVLPLLLAPLAAAVLVMAVYLLFHRVRLGLGVSRESCVCVDGQWVAAPLADGGNPALAFAPSLPTVSRCEDRYRGALIAVDAHQAVNAAHYVSAGAVSFARGLNDTPKIAALLLASRALSAPLGLALVGVAMAIGAVLGARRVAETMSRKITPMNHGQGFSANLVTAGLVLAASRFGLPVSTTHVSCGALFGVGAVTGGARWKTIGSIVLAWVITLPIAAGIASTAAFLLRENG